MLRNRAGALMVAGLVLVILILSAVASKTTPSGHDQARAGKPTIVQSSVPNAPRSSSGAPHSDSTSDSPSCTGSLTQPQLTTMLREGQARHTRVAPFGCVTVYKIKPGDTLWDIARTFTVHGADLTLYQWNQSVLGLDPDLIHPGQVVIVDPTGAVSTTRH